MINNNVNPQDVIDILNELIEIDAGAIHRLVESRVRCNSELADHPTCQVILEHVAYNSPEEAESSEDSYLVGLLGVLNAIFGKYDSGFGCIAAKYENDRVVGFNLLDEEGKII